MGGIYVAIKRAFDYGDGGPGGWWIAVEPEVHLGRDVFVPDVAGWRRERVPEYLRGAAWEVVPDWVCEVLSPRTARFDRATKLPAYAQHGVEWAWLVDPAAQTLEIMRLERGYWMVLATHSGDAVVRPQPFDAVDFPLDTLWLEPSA